MTKIPLKIRKQCASNPFYYMCARNEALHDHICLPSPLTGKLIEWDHSVIFGEKQVQEEWAIVPTCWWAHSGPGMKREINFWVALNRATSERLIRLSKARDLIFERNRLNNIYGVYLEPIAGSALVPDYYKQRHTTFIQY